MNMYKSLSITGLTVTDLSGSFDRATLFEIDNDKLKNLSKHELILEDDSDIVIQGLGFIKVTSSNNCIII